MNTPLIRVITTTILLSIIGVIMAGCATNPVTGSSDFVLMSEAEEISVGRRMHPEILKQYGKYDNPALQSYVQNIGRQLAAVSHRSNLIFRFTVLDSPEVNAFALPGGYIYITRGLLAYLDSEAQMAAVLGHEIGHVTARHSVRQQSAATATGLFGAILSSAIGVPGVGNVVNMAGTALIRGYGREHELEADRLGAEYLARARYDPNAMIEVIRVLKDQEIFDKQLAKEENREPRSYHGVFSTHPDNDQRLQNVVVKANKLRTGSVKRVNREIFLSKLDTLTFGDGEHDGIRRGRNFYHKDLNFTLQFPDRWAVKNQPNNLVAVAPGNDGVLILGVSDLNKRISPREFIRERMKIDNLKNGEAISQGNIKGYTGIADGKSPYGERQIRVIVLYYNEKAYIFFGAAKDANQPYKYDSLFLSTARSFHSMSNQEKKLAEPLRIYLIRAKNNTRFSDLARSSRIPHHAEEQLRLLNHYYPKGEPPNGRLLKIVR